MSVHLIDLRGASAAEAQARIRYEFGRGRPMTDSARLLVLDDTWRLVEHADSYGDVFISQRVRAMVCVAVGPPNPGGGGGPTLDRPGQIGPERDVTTLWVDDTTGFSWSLNPSGPDDQRPGAAVGPGVGLARLVELLGDPEIFDRVVALGRSLPEATASPGLSWLGDEEGGETVTAALSRAAEALVAEGRNAGRRGVEGWSYEGRGADAGRGPRPPAGEGSSLVDLVRGDRLSPQGEERVGWGETAARERDLRAWLAHVEADLESQSAWTGPLHDVTPHELRTEHLPAVGEALGALRDHIGSLFERLSSLPPDRLRAQLRAEGLTGASHDPEELAEAAAALAGETRGALARGDTIPKVAGDLEDLATRLSPQGSAAAAPRLRSLLPDRAVARLRANEGPPLPGPVSWLLVPAFAAPLLPALAGGALGVLGGLVLAAAWVGAVAAGLWRAGQGRGNTGRPGGESPSWENRGRASEGRATRNTLALHAGAAVAGVLSGLAASTSLLPEQLLGHPGPVAAGVFLGVGAGAAALVAAWVRAMVRWRDTLGLEQVGASASALTRLLGEVARAEWVLGGARRQLADTARAAASATRATADVVAELVDHEPDAKPRSRSFELEDVLRQDLIALATGVLDAVWEDPGEGRVSDLYDPAQRHAERLLEDYRAHLDLVGPYAAPSFADPALPRRPRIGVSPDRAFRALGEDPAGRMLQLCDPSHLRLLSQGSGVPRTVRFAPAALRPHRSQHPAQAPADVQWTGGHLVGQLRLVPLRSGVVRTEWRHEPDGGRAEAHGNHSGLEGDRPEHQEPVPDGPEPPRETFTWKDGSP
ncbi:hypothetical protein [Nocardiopsis nanhaiensis]